MVSGLDGTTQVSVVNLAMEELNVRTGRAATHYHNMGDWNVQEIHINISHATRANVNVCIILLINKINTKPKNVISIE